MSVEHNRHQEKSTNPMADMLESYLGCPALKPDQIISGAIVYAGTNEIVVDIGAKCEGIVPARDLERLSPAEREAIQVGDQISVCVINPEDEKGNIVLSMSRARRAQDWHNARELYKNQQTIEQQVVNCNKGGVIVQFGRIRGFVPGSQLAVSRIADQASSGQNQEERWASVVGETLQLKVIEVDQEQNRLILSERAALRDWQESQREKLLSELAEGDVRRGKVTNLVDFGAFVDIGGIDGLLHLSELSWKRVAHPSEVVAVGQEIDVYVLKVERERQRIALSIKKLQPDPWISAQDRYEKGQLVKGTVTRLTKWGAFASIEGDEAIEGLIHISELSDRAIAHPREVVKPDQVVTLRVISLDAPRHRLSLSLKQVSEGEFEGENWQAALPSNQLKPQNALSVSLSQAIEQSDEFQKEGISDVGG